MKVKREKVIYRRHAKGRKVLVIVVVLAALLAVGLALSGLFGRLFDAASSEPAASRPESAAASSVPAASETSQPSSSEPSPVTEETLRALSPDRSVLTDLSALERFCADAKAAGATAVVIDVKDEVGHPLYRAIGADTEQAELYAGLATRSDADPAYTVYDSLKPVADAVHAAGLQAVARINCFNDSFGGKTLPGARCTVSGGTTWVDNNPSNGGRSWLNPYAESAQNYNLAIAADCAGAGFDAILADYVQFPVGFSLNRIDYGAAADGVSKAQALAGFLRKMTESTSVPVYLTVRNLSAEGSDEFGGSPFDYAPETLAGFAAVLNAPANPRRETPAAPTGEWLASQPPVPYTGSKPVILSVIGSAVPDAWKNDQTYLILN